MAPNRAVAPTTAKENEAAVESRSQEHRGAGGLRSRHPSPCHPQTESYKAPT